MGYLGIDALEAGTTFGSRDPDLSNMDMTNFNLRGRALILSPLANHLHARVWTPFAALLPAYEGSEVEIGMKIVANLLQCGCIEFCCVGPLSEQLHDRIDEIIEDAEMFSIVTTFHGDEDEACEYFVSAAGAGLPSLLAFVAGHPSIAARLQALADHASN